MFTNIIVGVDGRRGGRDAIELARLLAAPDVRIALAHVYGTFSPVHAAEPRILRRELAMQLLERELERDAAGIDATLVALGDTTVGSGLKQLAARTEADLLVVGSCHHGILGRVLLGDDARAAVTEAPCAVAIAPTGYEPPTHLERIGVGYDGSCEANAALEIARSIANAQDGHVLVRAVVSLRDIPSGEPIPNNWPKVAVGLMDDKQRALRRLGDIEADATYGQPGEQLAHYSEHLDLLLIESRDYAPIDSLLERSSSRYLAQHAHCPLMVVPPVATQVARASFATRTRRSGAEFGDPANLQ
jgi:nucleotide-binding universal stress UspA family protein